jgi:autotransporter-associated beta strand protein
VESGTFSGVIAGAGFLIKTGSETLTLSGANTYEGGTFVSEGLINFNEIANFGTGNITLDGGGLQWATGNTTDISSRLNPIGSNGAILDTSSNNVTLAANLTGIGGIEKTGTGTLTLTGTSRYMGETTVTAGTLVGDTDSLNSNIVNNATLIFNQTEDGSYYGVISGTGSLTKTGSGTLILTEANTYQGGTTVANGTLVGDTSSLQGNIVNNSILEFNQSSNGTYSGALSGAGTLIKTGTGTLTLSGTNTYSGETFIKEGTVALATNLTSSNDLTLSGGTTFVTNNYSHSLANGTLNINGANGQSAVYDGNLIATNATLNFIAPYNPTEPILKVTGNADISNSEFNVGLTGDTALAIGAALSLIEVDPGNTLTATNLVKGSGIVQIGSTIAHDITSLTTVDPVSGVLRANAGPGWALEKSKALSEGQLSGMALAQQGSDFISDQGTSAAVSASSAAGAFGLAGFGAVSAASLRYNTGSHVNMRSVSLMLGLVWGANLNSGRFNLGTFFEYGNGSYDTHNSFSSSASVNGDGDTHYVGGGILGRLDFADSQSGHFFVEVSGRGGRVHNEYLNSDLRNAWGLRAEYETTSSYYGYHLGIGYVLNASDTTSLELSSKYFWTHQQGDTVTLSTGEILRFEDATSRRLRLGGRVTFSLNNYVRPYLGIAWEHEFDGVARATTNGYPITAPSLRGNTAIGELGMILKPSQTFPLSFELGVQAYRGKREGVTGNLKIKIEF